MHCSGSTSSATFPSATAASPPTCGATAALTSPAAGYTVDQVTDDLVAVLDGLEIREPVVLLAHSAGGLLAINFAARYPERLTKLVLVNTAAQSAPFQVRCAWACASLPCSWS